MTSRLVADASDDDTDIGLTTGLLRDLQACLDEHNQSIGSGGYVALCALTCQIHKQLHLVKAELDSAQCQRPPSPSPSPFDEDMMQRAWHTRRASVPTITIVGRGTIPITALTG